MFNCWATIIKNGVESGGAVKKAIVNFIGAQKVSIIDGIGRFIAAYNGRKNNHKAKRRRKGKSRKRPSERQDAGADIIADEYQLSVIQNPKDKFKYLAVKIKQWEKRQDKIRAEQMQSQQQMVQQHGQNQQAAVAGKVEGDIKKIYAQGDVSSKILELANQLGMQSSQLEGVIKKALQQDRGSSQLDKSIKTLEVKQQLETQAPF